MPITTTVTWSDLRNAYQTELSDLRDAYAELQTLATEEYGEDALTGPSPSDPSKVADDHKRLWAIQQQAEQMDESAKEIQKNQQVLTFLEDELGDGAFELKMLSGEETMQVETELRMYAQNRDVDVSVVQVKRNALIVDAATVDAPAGVPRDDDGSPTPSDAPNALTMALWQQVERFNNAGATDFRPEGLGGDSVGVSPPGVSSATPSASDPSPSPSAPTDDE